MSTRPIPGINNFLQQAIYKNKRIGLVTNNAAFTLEGIPSRVALIKNGFSLVKLFSPEHGLSVKGADGAFQDNTKDELTGLSVSSLYGKNLAPTEADMHDLDLVLFDIPDVGCRFYTYLWTMTYVMEACAFYQKPFIIADRPNPITGNLSFTEGPMLDENYCSSFIGRWSIPIRHSCTLGELALFIASTRMQNYQPNVISVKNWKRTEIADKEHFIPTSPAIKDVQTALLYPGMGLLEGINVNEGRGTPKPFRICGAPWINAHQLYEVYKQKAISNLNCNPISYIPTVGIYANQLCNGLELIVDNECDFHPVSMGICLMQTIAALYPDHIAERLYYTLANPSGTAHLDKLLGIKDSFMKLKEKESIPTNLENVWLPLIEPYLLY